MNVRTMSRATAALLAVLLSGCLAGSNVIEFDAGQVGRAYVPGQIISALHNAGYNQMPFKSFETDNEVKRTLRNNDTTEMRFLRPGEPTYIIVARYNTVTSDVWLSLSEDGRDSSGEQGQAELDLIRAALREQFGPHVIK